jgi:hypothetical protein
MCFDLGPLEHYSLGGGALDTSRILDVIGLVIKFFFLVSSSNGGIPSVIEDFFNIRLDRRNGCIKTNANVTPNTKWAHHIGFDNPSQDLLCCL